MRAAIRRTYGKADKILVEEMTTPKHKPDEVLVKVHATTVNRTDCAVLEGKPFFFRFFTGLPHPKTPILGSDFAGEVVAVGDHVARFVVGDKVFGFSDEGYPTQAEYLTIAPDKGICKIPEGVSYNVAAAAAEGAHYAYNFFNKVKLSEGDSVLVNGGTGAIGSALIQMLRYHGCKITATARSEHFDAVHDLGAQKVIDYTKEEFTECGETFPVVFDAVGKSSFKKCKKLLTPRGVYLSSELGEKNENPFLALSTPLLRRKKVVFPVPTNVPRSLEYVAKLLKENEFTPLIDRAFPLDEVQEAYRYVQSETKVGNVILEICDE